MRKTAAWIVIPLILCLTGCVVQSLYPWLSPETKLADDRLAGTWCDDGSVVFSATEDLEAFVRAQVADPSFFREDPWYRFTRAKSGD